jgi:solute carrier family 20 (sodium-dependent phosphate transporter)
MAWGIGANDVANSFATSVGSRTLKLWQACVIAGIFEFAGAIGLGGEVAKTVAGSIARTTYFEQYPEIFMYGMLCALVIASVWIILATYLEYAVSTTHSIVGAVLGFALAYGGKEAVVWADKQDDFPYYKGFVTIVMSWFMSPIISGGLAAIIFIINRYLILRRERSTLYAFIALPILAFSTVYINIFFVLFKGARNELGWEANKCAWVAALVALGGALVMIPVTFWLKKRHEAYFDKMEAEAAAAEAEQKGESGPVKEGRDVEDGTIATPVAVRPSSPGRMSHDHMARANSNRVLPADAAIARPIAEGKEDDEKAGAPAEGEKKDNAVWAFLKKGVTADVHEDIHKNDFVSNMHMNAEVFSARTEGVYKYLQVFSACCVAFAHGANDVANAVGPFTGMWYVYNNHKISSTADLPRWILVLGAVGLVAGLAMYGYNIIKVIGVNLATMTPSRGFSAELATGLTISLASVYGIPVSTTQIIVGAEMGVGLTESVKHGANWKLFAKTFAGWVFTIIFAASMSAALFCYGIYAPSEIMSRTITDYQNDMRSVINTQLKDLNSTNYLVNKTLGLPFNKQLNTDVTWLSTNLSALFNFKKYGAMSRYDLIEVRTNTTKLYNDHHVVTVGYRKSTLSRNTTHLTVSA